MKLLLVALTVTMAQMARATTFEQVRDAAPVAIRGTATITGVVVSREATPHPLSRAIVTIIGSKLPEGRSVIADDAGRFTFRNLPADRVTMSVSKHGYVASAYGALRLGGPGTAVTLADGQTLDVVIALTPAAVVTGVIRNARGQPVPGLRVFAIDARRPEAPDFGGVVTDDRGVYRIYDLVPHDYLVVATVTTNTALIVAEIDRRSEADTDRLLASLRDRGSQPERAAPAVPASSAETWAPIFYPGTAVLADATRITLAAGDVADGLDFIVTPVAVTTIDGIVVNPDGSAPSAVNISIDAGGVQIFNVGNVNPLLTLRLDSDGHFTYSTIAPGHYTISAQSNRVGAGDSANGRGGRGGASGGPPIRCAASAGAAGDKLYAVQDVDVYGQPVTGVTLRLQHGPVFSGKVVIDRGSNTPPAEVSTVCIGLRRVSDDGSEAGGVMATATARADGTFDLPAVAPGRYRPALAVPPTPGASWWLRSAVVSGQDLLDSTLTLTPGTDVTGAVLTVTDRQTELAGTLQLSSGRPAPNYFIVVFPVDASLRVPNSRRVKFTRPATDGSFGFSNLPPGDYVLVALTDLDPDEWQTSAFLASVELSGVKVTIHEGQKTEQVLRISGGALFPQ
jgi:hypothetical protein